MIFFFLLKIVEFSVDVRISHGVSKSIGSVSCIPSQKKFDPLSDQHPNSSLSPSLPPHQKKISFYTFRRPDSRTCVFIHRWWFAPFSGIPGHLSLNLVTGLVTLWPCTNTAIAFCYISVGTRSTSATVVTVKVPLGRVRALPIVNGLAFFFFFFLYLRTW